MSMPWGQSIRTVLAVSATAVALLGFSLPVRAGGEGGAIAAGVAGGVAGVMAGQALQNSLPPPGYNPAYPPPPNCWTQLQQQQGPYSYHIGEVRVCE